ncbi:signal peptidase II [Streptomyces sp. NPDC093097]|uniref:signal peptidase II n=1 Tax=Streptomyces sp. NPDC093097 TaxID=3366027 RepID=UPI0037F45BE0
MTDAQRATGAADEGVGGEEGSGGRRRLLLLLLVAGAVYALDLVSKLIAVTKLENHAPVPVIGDWLEIRVLRNSGAAFGLGGAMTLVFTLIAAAVVVTIIRLARKLRSIPWAIALGLLLGGALGNLTDRLFRAPGGLQGAVVDFISVRDFSVMNLADWAIVCGGTLIVFFSFRGWELSGGGAAAGRAGAEAVGS